MKKTIPFLFVCFLSTNALYAQNTFPSSGNVGIGTTSPAYLLDVSGIFRTTGDIIAPSINGQYIGYGSSGTTNSFAVGTNILNGASNTGYANVAVGHSVLSANTTGYWNVALGTGVLYANTTGYGNTAVGSNTMGLNTTGIDNTAIGVGALYNNTTGNNSVAIGNGTLAGSTSASMNTGVGYSSGSAVTTGSQNTFLGWQSGRSITTGYGNTFVGFYSGQGVTGSNNTILGGYSSYNSLGLTSGSGNTIIGSNFSGLSPTLTNHIILGDGNGNQRLIIDDAGNVGIGTTTPTRQLEVVSGTGVGPLKVSGPNGYLLVDNVGSGQSFYQANTFHQFQGTSGTPILTMLASGNVGIGTTIPNGQLEIAGGANRDFLLTSSYSLSGSLRLRAWGSGVNFDPQANSGTFYFGRDNSLSNFIIQSGNVAIGTTDPKGYKLAVAGDAIAESMTVKLQANWPDYTFKKEYHLMPLADLKTYVDKNQHLPEIPSAAQVEKDGINLGEMNRLLLKKVEELTLYLIEKDKQDKIREQEVTELKKQVAELVKAANKNK